MSLKLRQHIARVKQLGGSDIKQSERKHKKLAVKVENKWVHFGDDRYSDYTKHKDDKRKNNYQARHKGILKKDGTRAIDDKNSAAFWSYHLLWS